jgi:transposase-like protein
MARRAYTPEERAHALKLYREHGQAHASRETGIPPQTIGSWASRAGVRSDASARTAAATEAAAVLAEQRRAARKVTAEEHAGEALQEARTVRRLLVAAVGRAHTSENEDAQQGRAAIIRAMTLAYRELLNAGTARLDDAGDGQDTGPAVVYEIRGVPDEAL